MCCNLKVIKKAMFPRSAPGPKKTREESIPESTPCKRSLNVEDADMGKKVVKRARVEIEPLQVKTQVS